MSKVRHSLLTENPSDTWKAVYGFSYSSMYLTELIYLYLIGVLRWTQELDFTYATAPNIVVEGNQTGRPAAF